MRVGIRIALPFVALMMATSALAAQGSFDLRSSLPITVEGDRSIESDDGQFLLQGDGGRVAFLLQSGEGTIERVIHRAYASVRSDDPDAGFLWNQKVEREDLPLQGALVTLDQRLDGFTLLAFGGKASMQDGARNVPLHLGALTTPLTIASEAQEPIRIILGEADSEPFVHAIQPGTYAARATSGLTTMTGDFELYLGEAVIDYQSQGGDRRLLAATFREEQRSGALYDPVQESWTGPGTHTEYVHEYLVLHLADARLQVQFADTPASMYSAAPTAHVDGLVSFPAAGGTVSITDDDEVRTHEIHGQQLDLAGRLHFDLTGVDKARTATDVQGEGDITQVTYAAETHSYDWATVAAVTGLGALLVGIAAWATGAGKWLFGATGGAIAGYARVHGEEILEHPGRLEVYERVKAEPGMHFMDLCQRVDFGASTLNYHLRVLERNGFVSRVKDGRYVRFFDQKSGAYSQERKQAASTLRNDTTAAIASHIIHNPGVVQRDLASRFGIAPSTVSWHVQRLQRDGLVEKERDHHFTRYYMGDAWVRLPDEELARVGLVG